MKKMYDDYVVEAKEWLKQRGEKAYFAPNFDGSDWIKNVIDKLYQMGALTVYVGADKRTYKEYLNGNEDIAFDTMFISLPKDQKVRERVLIFLFRINPDEIELQDDLLRLWWD